MKSVNKSLAIGFVVAGFQSWFWPGFNGYFAMPSNVSIGEGHITGAIFFVGAGIVWFLRSTSQSKDRD
jgi:uncharacterized membrane protein (UPF0136 family)